MKLADLLKGKKIKYLTDALIEVELEIKNAKEEHHSRDLVPATIQNDWWNPTENWTTIEVEFTNGFKKSYRSLSEINLIN